MASFHFSAQIISRAKGRSAIAAAAYRAGARLADDETGRVADFANRRGVVHQEIMVPEGGAAWLADRQALWNHVHRIERRKDAQLAREFNLALPHELTAEERCALLRGFVREQFVGRGMVADLAIHAPTDNDMRNHHAHVMVTLRKATPAGLYRVKTREWNSDALLQEWRAGWADWQNRFLERSGHRDRVDHRTLAAQAADARTRGDRFRAASLDHAPEIHIGPQAQQAARRQWPPRSTERIELTARSGQGTWRSAKAEGKRQRMVDYPRIDTTSRAAYNAQRAALGAKATARRVEHMRRRDARLRLIEVRYARAVSAADEALRDLARQRWRSPALASRQQALMLRRGEAQRRLAAARAVIGRLDGLLAGLFRLHERGLQRSRTLMERLEPRRVLTRTRGGRTRDLPFASES